jgi:tRNA threonylcarbamoyladenosine biosynthesis protein TsaE
MTEYNVKTYSADETEKAGYELARLVKSEGALNFIAMYGDLGAGKTAFTRGVAEYVAPGAAVTSPTYSIVNEYTPEGGKRPTLFHFDMYRISDEDGLDSIDFDNYFTRGALIITEWSENIGFALPEHYVKVVIDKISDTERLISIKEIGG